MADVRGLEIGRPGIWELATGPLDVTPEMLQRAAENATAAGTAFRASVHLGHIDPRFDGEPALGWLHSLRIEGSGDDTVLLGDVTGMPDWLAELGKTAYPDRSIEGWTTPESDDLEITGLALLGVTPPGMSTIRSLRDIPQALGFEHGIDLAAAVGQRYRHGWIPIGESGSIDLKKKANDASATAEAASKKAARLGTPDAHYDAADAHFSAAGAHAVLPTDAGRAKQQYHMSAVQHHLDEANLSTYKPGFEGEGHTRPGSIAEGMVAHTRRRNAKPGFEGEGGTVPGSIAEGMVRHTRRHRASEPVPVAATAVSWTDVAAAGVSTTPWSQFSDADYSDEQYARACVLDRGVDAGTAKQRYSLPVREPSGALNRNGVIAAAGRVDQVKNASPEQIRAAARKLVSLYRNQLDAEPPPGLMKVAGMVAASAAGLTATLEQQLEQLVMEGALRWLSAQNT